MANMNVKAACPNGWTEAGGTLYHDGCLYAYTYCYGLLNGLHCMSFNYISVQGPCDGDDYDNNKKEINDLILLQIGQYLESINFFGEPIPECPEGTMCLLRIYDAYCYSGWYSIKGWYFPIKCDDQELRSCNETIYYCWEDLGNGQRILRVIRDGYMSGPPCPQGCNSSCE